MSTVPPNNFDLIESLVNKLPPKAQEDARSLFQAFSGQIATNSKALGIPSGSNKANVATPPQASLSVSGSNAAYTLTVTPPSLNPAATLWYRISYSAIKGFTSGVTTLNPTTSTGMVLNLPNQSLFFQIETAYTNQGPWSQAALASQTAAASGLVSSAATSDAGAFNQTNLAVVTSVAIGATAAIQVQGAGGSLSSMVRLKGSQQLVRPGATVIGIAPGSTQYVGWDRDQYIVRPTLAALIDDSVEPVGKVSVVNTGTPVLPTIVPILSGGQILGYNVTNGGAGAVGPYTLTLGSVGLGTGATFGAQTIVGGVLISVAPGNPGINYSGATTVTASGGSVFPGTDGGGTAEGNTNGRLTI